MNLIGYLVEMLAVWMFISAFRQAKRRDFLDERGTEEGKKFAAKMRGVAVGRDIVIGCILLVVGLWMVGAF